MKTEINDLEDLSLELLNLNDTLKLVDTYKNSDNAIIKEQLKGDVDEHIDNLRYTDVDELINIDRQDCEGCQNLDDTKHERDNYENECYRLEAENKKLKKKIGGSTNE